MSVEHRTPAKKRLEYWPEPTSLRPRNRPEMVPCRHGYPERNSKELGSQRLAGELKSESRNSESREIRQQHTADGIATIHTETCIGLARISLRAVARITGDWHHRGKSRR